LIWAKLSHLCISWWYRKWQIYTNQLVFLVIDRIKVLNSTFYLLSRFTVLLLCQESTILVYKTIKIAMIVCFHSISQKSWLGMDGFSQISDVSVESRKLIGVVVLSECLLCLSDTCVKHFSMHNKISMQFSIIELCISDNFCRILVNAHNYLVHNGMDWSFHNGCWLTWLFTQDCNEVIWSLKLCAVLLYLYIGWWDCENLVT
jgi:hypothetical protein